MARAISWVLGTVDQLARALGISPRTARRRAADRAGAQKIGRTWVIPLTAAEYAAAEGVSIRTARRATAVARSAADPLVQSAMPTNLVGRQVPHQRGGRMVNPRIWPYQYQGYAWLRFVASGEVIRWFTGIIVSKVKMSTAALRSAIRAEVDAVFSSSPVAVLEVGYVYARQA